MCVLHYRSHLFQKIEFGWPPCLFKDQVYYIRTKPHKIFWMHLRVSTLPHLWFMLMYSWRINEAWAVIAPLLQIWDTAGQERFRSVTHAYYRDAQGKYDTFTEKSDKSSSNRLHYWCRVLLKQWVTRGRELSCFYHGVLMCETKWSKLVKSLWCLASSDIPFYESHSGSNNIIKCLIII